MGHLSRREFLRRSAALAAAGAGATLWTPSWVRREAQAQTNGLISHPDLATYARTIYPSGFPSSTDPYRYLEYREGWPLVTRTIDTEPRRGREDRRVALLSLLQITDVQVPDAQSPARVEWMGHIRDREDRLEAAYPLRAAWRPHETAINPVGEAALRASRDVGRGPATGRSFDFAVSTGDNIDNMQENELDWFLTLLNGGQISANSGDSGRYEGVQQYPSETDDPLTYDRRYWHPDPLPERFDREDQFKEDFDYPTLEGFLEAALAPFTARGIGVPWYSAYGNHDGLVQGNVQPNPMFQEIAVGPVKFLGPPAGYENDPDGFLRDLEAGEISQEDFFTAPFRLVTPDERRRFVGPWEYVRRHIDSGGRPQGHGFTEDNLGDGSGAPGSGGEDGSLYSERDNNTTLYYHFEPTDSVRCITLDTANRLGGATGSIGLQQYQWLEQRLREVHSRWFDTDGNEQRGDGDDRLVVLFAHHNLPTMDNLASSPDDPVRVPPDMVEDLLHRFPNVIAFINGHSHINRVWARPDPQGRTEGFWELSTSAQLDYPMQTRAIEVVDNRDGTLSIFSSIIDQEGPANPREEFGDWSTPDADIRELAGYGRELAYNDFRDFEEDREDGRNPFDHRVGSDEDRNVELILAAPFTLRDDPDDREEPRDRPDRRPDDRPDRRPDDRPPADRGRPLPTTGAGIGIAAGAAALSGVVALRERAARRELEDSDA